MSWGSSIWGNGPWSEGDTSTVVVEFSPVTKEPVLRSFSLFFSASGDLGTTTDAQAVKALAKGSTMTLLHGIPLSTLGSLVPALTFNQDEQVLGALVDYQAQKGLASGAPNLSLTQTRVLDVQSNQTVVGLAVVDNRFSQTEIPVVLGISSR